MSSNDDGHHLVTVTPGVGDDHELISYRLWQHGAVGVEEIPTGLRAAFTTLAEAEQARDLLAPGRAIETVADTHGLDAARDLLTVEAAGRFVVHPPWLTAPDDRIGIEIDPGHTFGSGSHPSTRLALSLLGEEHPPPRTVFDVGCGSGVLAIGAATLGATVTAVDIDPAAVATTGENARRNEVDHLVEARVGSIESEATPVDLVLVNVTIDIHERLAPLLSPAHRRLIVAGVLGEDQLARAATAYGGVAERTLGEDGWMAAVLIRS